MTLACAVMLFVKSVNLHYLGAPKKDATRLRPSLQVDFRVPDCNA